MIFRFFCLIGFTLIFSNTSYALEFGCSVMPSELAQLGTRILKKVHSERKPFPDDLNLSTHLLARVQSTDEQKNAKVSSTVEGFYRPTRDEGYVYFAIPILRFELSRAHSVVYLCAHADLDPQKTHISIYFLNGYGLDPIGWRSGWGDLLHPTQMTLSPIEVGLIGVGFDDWLLFPFLESIPILGRVTSIPTGILEELNLALGEFFTRPFGGRIERIVLTPDYLQLDSDVDLNHPEKASVFFRFNFGTGVAETFE